MHVCVCVCIYMYVYMYVFAARCVHACMRACLWYKHAYIQWDTTWSFRLHTNIDACIRWHHAHTHIRTYKHLYTLTCIHTIMAVCAGCSVHPAATCIGCAFGTAIHQNGKGADMWCVHLSIYTCAHYTFIYICTDELSCIRIIHLKTSIFDQLHGINSIIFLQAVLLK